jgi:hypothetical protein
MLQRLSESFLAGLVFEFSTAYERSNAVGVGLLLGQLRNQLEGAAGFLVEENAALRELFAGVAPKLPDAGLRERLVAAVALPDPGLRVGPLREQNEVLRGLLVELHAHAEDVGHVGIEQQIWQELAQSVRRRERLEAGADLQDPEGFRDKIGQR